MINSKEYIPLDRAKGFIVDALMQFDPNLGRRADGIFASPERLNIQEIPEPKERMIQQCRPAKSKDNPNDYAIIDYEYDGTPLSVVHLAHEVGHAIADDLQRASGRSHKDYSEGQMEEQASFVQQVVSANLPSRLGQTALHKRDLGEDVSVMSPHRAAWFKAAKEVFNLASNSSLNNRGAIVLEALTKTGSGSDLVI